MRVSEAMTRDVTVARPDQSIQEVARTMADIGTGVLPVGDHDRLVGMITDRDIALRAVAAGKGPDARVRDVMTPEVRYCFDDEDIDDVAHQLSEQQIRRVPVINRDKRLVGILSIGDIAVSDQEPVGEALAGICRRGGRHNA